MEQINRRVQRFDRFQRSHPIVGFPIAVVKKYSEDRGGYQAALLTYYGFLSLFPTVLITITLVRWLLQSDSHLKQRIITSVTSYFPLIGTDLQENLHGFSKTGLPFLIGMLVLIYGLRGAADVFRHTVNNVWHVPEDERSGFWAALGRSALIIMVAGVGFFGSAVLTGYANAASYHLLLRFILLILQNIGRYLLSHELRNLNNLYGAFAAVLGFFFWVYLQSQIIVYAMEINSVHRLKMWPRSLVGKESE
jgi:uncharacterized BrkB/YihY/UPF0761 family membrane protein